MTNKFWKIWKFRKPHFLEKTFENLQISMKKLKIHSKTMKFDQNWRGACLSICPINFGQAAQNMPIKVKPDNLGIKMKLLTRAFQKYFVFIVWSIFSWKMHACKNNKIVRSLEVVPLTLPSCMCGFFLMPFLNELS